MHEKCNTTYEHKLFSFFFVIIIFSSTQLRLKELHIPYE